MYTKFILRVRCNEGGEIRGIFAQALKKRLEDSVGFAFDCRIRYLNRYWKMSDLAVNPGERHSFEFTVFDRNAASLLISRLFNLRIHKTPLEIADSEFVVLDLIFRDNQVPESTCKDISLVINTPYLMKWGDVFMEKFEKELFYRELFKNASGLDGMCRSGFEKLLNKIDIDYSGLRTVVVRLNSFPATGFMGELVFKFSEASEDEMNMFYDILNHSCYRGIGARKEFGFGNLRFNI